MFDLEIEGRGNKRFDWQLMDKLMSSKCVSLQKNANLSPAVSPGSISWLRVEQSDTRQFDIFKEFDSRAVWQTFLHTASWHYAIPTKLYKYGGPPKFHHDVARCILFKTCEAKQIIIVIKLRFVCWRRSADAAIVSRVKLMLFSSRVIRFSLGYRSLETINVGILSWNLKSLYQSAFWSKKYWFRSWPWYIKSCSSSSLFLSKACSIRCWSRKCEHLAHPCPDVTR